MREQRWESRDTLSFPQVLDVFKRYNADGARHADPADLDRERICYIEEWPAPTPSTIQRLDDWTLEDVTMIHVLDAWTGDFFLLAGRYHSTFQRYPDVEAYCSISHPWRLSGHWVTLHPQSMLWVGFRHTHSFIRIRLHTTDVIPPGERHVPHHPSIWLEERQAAFREAIDSLGLAVDVSIQNDRVMLRSEQRVDPFFCSWPDAFGPCQFELNATDPFAFLVPASGLAATHQPPTAPIRMYLTGFDEEALHAFKAVEPGTRTIYRCSAHARIADLPAMLAIIGDGGRLYTTVTEFHMPPSLPDHPDVAVAVIGIIGTAHHYKIEARFNVTPLPPDAMEPWLETLLSHPMTYAPLSPFP